MLSSDEAEAVVKLEDEGLEGVDQPVFELALLDGLPDAKEIDVVAALEDFVGLLGHRLREGDPEVVRFLFRDSSFVGLSFDLIEQNVATPAELRGSAQVVEPGGGVGNPCERIRMVTPGNGRQ